MISGTEKVLQLFLMALKTQVYGLIMNYKSKARIDCAKEAGKENTEYAAKQIDKTYLAGVGLKP